MTISLLNDQEYSVLDNGFNRSLIKTSIDSVTPDLQHVITSGITPANITSGDLSADLQHVGTIFNGKTTFDNVDTGFILGVDSSDNVVKFFIGSSSSYFDWNGTALTISGSLTATTITGGTFQTATSGQRIRIVSASATSPTQNANSLMLINANGDDILDFGSNGSIIMRILPTHDDVAGLLIQNDSNLAVSTRLLEVDMQKSTSSATAVFISQAGTGSALAVSAINSSQTNYVVSIDGATYLRNLVEISSAFNSNNGNNMLHISHTGASGSNTLLKLETAGIGYGMYISVTNSSNSSNGIFMTYGGAGRMMEIDQTNSSNSNIALYVTTNNTTALPIYAQGGTVSTHFNRVIGSGAYTIWVSDGTSPNGNLSGNIGDICLGGTSGHMFWNNNGSTGWTQI